MIVYTVTANSLKAQVRKSDISDAFFVRYGDEDSDEWLPTISKVVTEEAAWKLANEFVGFVKENFKMSPQLKRFEDALDSGKVSVAMKHGNWWKARRNGKTKLWKTRPDEFEIPIKAGLKTCTRVGPTFLAKEGNWWRIDE